MLDLNKVLAGLREERQLIEDAIARLERLSTTRRAIDRREPSANAKMTTVPKGRVQSAGGDK